MICFVGLRDFELGSVTAPLIFHFDILGVRIL